MLYFPLYCTDKITKEHGGQSVPSTLYERGPGLGFGKKLVAMLSVTLVQLSKLGFPKDKSPFQFFLVRFAEKQLAEYGVHILKVKLCAAFFPPAGSLS